MANHVPMQAGESAGRFDRQDRLAIALLTLLVLLAFGNVVFGGRSLIPSEHVNPLDHRANERSRGPDFITHEAWQRRNLVSHPNFRDIAASTVQFEPSQEFFRRSLLRGEFPFWDPYIGGGNPSFASLVPAYLFPPGLLVVLLGNGSLVRNAYILLLMICAGTLTYLLLRRHGLDWRAALAGAITFAFSGAVIQTAPSGLGQPVAFFALPLLVTARFLAMPSIRRAAQLALVFAFVALATFPPILMQSFGACVVYLIVTLCLRPRGNRGITASLFAAGAVTSLAIVGVAYIPATLLMSEVTHVKQHYESAADQILRPHQIAQILSPTIMGGARVYANAAVKGTTSLHLYYTGIAALVLCGIGLLAKAAPPSRVLKITSAITAALSLAKVFGVPPVEWISHVPMLRNIHYAAYFGILIAFAVSVLAALGVESLIRGNARRWHLFVTGTAVLLLMSIVLNLAWRSGVQFHPHGWRWIADFRLLIVFSALAILIASLGHEFPRRNSAAVFLLVILLAVEGITNSVYPRPRRWNVWRNPPHYVVQISEMNTGGRVLPMPIYPANTQSVYQQPTIDTIVFSSTRMSDLYRRYFNPDSRLFLLGTSELPPERVLDVANVEYVAIISSKSAEIAASLNRGYEILEASDLLHLMRRQTSPRYTFTTNFRVSGSPTAILEALPNLETGVVLLEEHPRFPSDPSFSAASPRVVGFSLNEVEIEINAPRAGLLVCSESNMAGWTATVDGAPTRILAANYAFRAVEVPPGVHTIRFRYRPPGLITGLVSTLAGLTACLFGLWWPRRDRHEPVF